MFIVQLKIWGNNSKALMAADATLLDLAKHASSENVVVLHNVYPNISGNGNCTVTDRCN
jgi:hypothetical protein